MPPTESESVLTSLTAADAVEGVVYRTSRGTRVRVEKRTSKGGVTLVNVDVGGAGINVPPDYVLLADLLLDAEDSKPQQHTPRHAALSMLGYDAKQIARMNAATTDAVLTQSLRADSVSIKQDGSFAVLNGKGQPAAPVAQEQQKQEQDQLAPAPEPVPPPRKRGKRGAVGDADSTTSNTAAAQLPRVHLTRLQGHMQGRAFNDALTDKVLLIGSNGAGKTTRTRAVELLLDGSASDVVGRDVSREATTLALLRSPGTDRIDLHGELSDATQIGYRLRTEGKTVKTPEPDRPASVLVRFPLRDALAELTGSPQRAQRWLLSVATTSDVTEATVLTRLGDALAARWKQTAEPTKGVLDNLTIVRAEAGRRGRDANASVKASKAAMDAAGASAVPLDDAALDTLRERLAEARSAVEARVVAEAAWEREAAQAEQAAKRAVVADQQRAQLAEKVDEARKTLAFVEAQRAEKGPIIQERRAEHEGVLTQLADAKTRVADALRTASLAAAQALEEAQREQTSTADATRAGRFLLVRMQGRLAATGRAVCGLCANVLVAEDAERLNARRRTLDAKCAQLDEEARLRPQASTPGLVTPDAWATACAADPMVQELAQRLAALTQRVQRGHEAEASWDARERGARAVLDAYAALEEIEAAQAPDDFVEPEDADPLTKGGDSMCHLDDLRADAEEYASELSRAEQAKGAWDALARLRQQRETAETDARQWGRLKEEVEALTTKLVAEATAAFCSRVQKHLPATDAFFLDPDSGAFGLLRDVGNAGDGATTDDGIVNGQTVPGGAATRKYRATALSGAEWVRVTVAIAMGAAPSAVPAGTTAVLDVIVPPDRAWDADTLRAALVAWTSYPGQVIATSTVRPTGKAPKGWTIIDVEAASASPVASPATPTPAAPTPAPVDLDENDL